jgi:hypothetical protein
MMVMMGVGVDGSKERERERVFRVFLGLYVLCVFF